MLEKKKKKHEARFKQKTTEEEENNRLGISYAGLGKLRRRGLLPVGVGVARTPVSAEVSVGWWRSAIPSTSLLRAPSAVWISSPIELLHGRGTATQGSLGTTATTDAAAEDGEKEKPTKPGGDADNEVFVVLDPRGDFFAGAGAFASAL